jgi:hypothetical protein
MLAQAEIRGVSLTMKGRCTTSVDYACSLLHLNLNVFIVSF